MVSENRTYSTTSVSFFHFCESKTENYIEVMSEDMNYCMSPKKAHIPCVAQSMNQVAIITLFWKANYTSRMTLLAFSHWETTIENLNATFRADFNLKFWHSHCFLSLSVLQRAKPQLFLLYCLCVYLHTHQKGL